MTLTSNGDTKSLYL